MEGIKGKSGQPKRCAAIPFGEEEREVIDKSKITVTMSMEEYEHYARMEEGFREFVRILERANQNGTAVMTDELKETIEEIYA